MVLETKIEAKVVAGVDKGSFNKVEQVAKDTGKKINQDLKLKMEVDIAKAQQKLKILRTQLKSKDLTAAQRLQIQIDTNRAQRNLTQLKREMNNLVNTGKTSTSRLSRLFSGVGKSIASSLINPVTIAITAIYALGRAVTNATKTAISFETAFVGVQKTFDDTAEGYAELDKGLRKLTKRMPLAYEEIAKIAEVSAQLGVTGRADLLKFTEVAAGLGIATNVSAEDAATSLKRFSDVLGIPISQIENLGSALVGLGNNFAANEDEILQFAKKTQTAGIVSNLSATEILGLSTALVASGINAEAGGTSMVKAFDKINTAVAKGSTDLAKFAQVAGLSSDEFATLFNENAGDAFVKLLEGLGSAGSDAGQVLDELGINSSRMRQAFLAASGNVDTLRDAINTANKSFEDNTALQDEVDKRLQSTEGRLDIAKNKWRDLSATVGKAFNTVRVPVFEGITNGIDNFVKNTKVSFKLIGNIFYNLDVAASNAALGIIKGFQSAVKGVTNFINTLIKGYNKVSGIAGGKPLKLIEYDPKELNLQKKAYRDISAGTQEILDEYDYAKKRQVSLAEDKVKKELAAEKDLLNQLAGLDKTSGGLSKKIDDTKEYEDAVKDMGKVAGQVYDDLTKKIEGSVAAQKSLKDELAGIDKDIASRIVEIDKALAGDDVEPADRQALIKERESAFTGIKDSVEKDPIKVFNTMTEEEKAKILADFQELREKGKTNSGTFAGLITDAEKAKLKAQVDEITEYEKLTEIEKLQALKAEKQTALEEEVAREQDLLAQKEELQNNYAEFLKSKVADEMSLAEQLRQKRLAVAAARSKAGGGSTSSVGARAAGGPITAGSPYIVGERGPELIVPQNNGQVIPNHNLTINQNVNADVAGGTDIDQLANALARKITLAGKGIL